MTDNKLLNNSYKIGTIAAFVNALAELICLPEYDTQSFIDTVADNVKRLPKEINKVLAFLIDAYFSDSGQSYMAHAYVSEIVYLSAGLDLENVAQPELNKYRAGYIATTRALQKISEDDSLGSRLENMRAISGLAQFDFSESKISQQQVSSYENNLVTPSVTKLKTLAIRMQCCVEMLVGEAY